MIKSLKMNPTIWYLTINDVFTWGIFFVFLALVGLYIAQKFNVNAVEVVGIGGGIAYLTRGIVQVPFGVLGDKLETTQDETIMLMLGNFLMGLPILLFTQINDVNQYYILQFVFGLGAALNIVNWRKLFAGNLDKGKEGLEYAVYDSIMSFSIAALSVLGGTIAGISPDYFDVVIATIGSVIILSNFWVLFLYNYKKKIGKY